MSDIPYHRQIAPPRIVPGLEANRVRLPNNHRFWIRAENKKEKLHLSADQKHGPSKHLQSLQLKRNIFEPIIAISIYDKKQNRDVGNLATILLDIWQQDSRIIVPLTKVLTITYLFTWNLLRFYALHNTNSFNNHSYTRRRPLHSSDLDKRTIYQAKSLIIWNNLHYY